MSSPSSSFILQHLERSSPKLNELRRVAYFPQSRSENLTAIQVLLTLLRQLVEEFVDLPSSLDAFTRIRKKVLNILEIKQAFKSIFRCSQEIFIVIDEIDAIDEWPEILDFFADLAQSSESEPNPRLLIFNQPNWLLDEKLKGIRHGCIDIVELNSADINDFVISKFRAIDRIARNPDLENRLRSLIVSRAQGWFVEANLVVSPPS